MIDHVDIPPGNPALGKGREGGMGEPGQGQGHAPPEEPHIAGDIPVEPLLPEPLPSPARAEPCACTWGLANRCDRQDDVTYKRKRTPSLS